MTFDTTPQNTDAPADGATEGAAPARKAPRRRVTRTVAAPSTPAPEVAAPVEPVVDPDAPVEDEETPVEESPVEVAPVEVVAPVREPAAPVAPKRSRRVTRTVVLPPVGTPAEAQPAQPAPAAVADTAPVVAEPEDAAPSLPAADATPADAPVGTDTDAVVVAPKKRAPRRSRKAADAPAPEAAVEPATTEPAPEQAPTPTPALDVLAELAGTVATKPPAEPRTVTPRLATTAVLFQAPDPESRPRRRRASSAAGSPAAISEAAAAQHVAEVPDTRDTLDAVVESAPEAAAPARPERTSRRRGRRGATAATEIEIETETEELIEGLTDQVETDDAATAEPDETDEIGSVEGDESDDQSPRRRRRRGGRGRRGRAGGEGDADDAVDDDTAPVAASGDEADDTEDDAEGDEAESEQDEQGGSSRRRRRRRRSGRGETAEAEAPAPSRTRASRAPSDEVTALRGSTRLEAKRQRRREGRDAGRRRQVITESEFLARREAVERTMVVRERDGRTQIAVLEDGVLVEHYVSRQAQLSMAGNVYLGRVQNVLPSMEAAFVDVGKGRNAVLYAGEVNWDAAGLEGQPRRIEQALKSGDSVLVQVTKDPIGHKGARLTSQVTLAGRYLVYVPGGGMTGISRKLPDVERNRLKKILREIVPESAGVIVRTAAEGASEDELRADIARLQGQWESISKKAKTASAPALLQGEPDLAIRVVRDIFNDDFSSLVVQGAEAWSTISGYIGDLAPDLASKVTRWTSEGDVFAAHRVDEQLAKGMDRKVWLPSGGSLVIDRTEAMTVVDVNTGKFTGSGGTLEETVTRNNLEAAEEIVRQLRLRDIGGIIVIDFIDMVLELNRDLVLRRLVECLGRDRTKHQVAEVTSLGLVQMTRKRVGQGLVEAFSETCEHCNGRGFIVHAEPIERAPRPEAVAPAPAPAPAPVEQDAKRSRRKRGGKDAAPAGTSPMSSVPVLPEAREAVKATLATIAAAAAHAHEHGHEHAQDASPADVPVDAPQPGADLSPETTAAAPAAPVTDAADVPAPAEAADGATFPGGEALVPEPAASGAPGADDAVAELDAVAGETLELTPVDPSTFDEPEDAPALAEAEPDVHAVDDPDAEQREGR